MFNSSCIAFGSFSCSPTSLKIKFDKKDFNIISYEKENSPCPAKIYLKAVRNWGSDVKASSLHSESNEYN